MNAEFAAHHGMARLLATGDNTLVDEAAATAPGIECGVELGAELTLGFLATTYPVAYEQVEVPRAADRYGVECRATFSNYPGRVVYEDDGQVVFVSHDFRGQGVP